MVHHACRYPAWNVLARSLAICRTISHSYSYSHQLNATIRCHTFLRRYARATSFRARATVILRPGASAIVRIGRHRTLARAWKMIPLSRRWRRKQLWNELTLRPIRQRSPRGDWSVMLHYESAGREFEAIPGTSPTLYRNFIVAKKITGKPCTQPLDPPLLYLVCHRHEKKGISNKWRRKVACVIKEDKRMCQEASKSSSVYNLK